MPRVMLAILVLAVLAAPARAGRFEEGGELFRKATASTDPEEARRLFRGAAEVWESLAAAGTVNTRIYTNAGNARSFAGDLGEAVLAYRRALLVDPGNDRARDALDAIRERLGVADREGGAGSSLIRALFFWHDALTPGARKALFAAAWAGAFALLLLARGKRRRRMAAAGLAMIAVALLASLVVSDAERRRSSDAVLVVRTEGRTGDGGFYSTSHTAPLPAGAELKILERRSHDGDWIHGQLRDGTTTWLPATVVEAVVP